MTLNPNWFLNATGQFTPIGVNQINVVSTTTTTGFLTFITNATTANIAGGTTATWVDGPVISQGSSGTWFAHGTVCFNSAANDAYYFRLWDGTTIINQAAIAYASVNEFTSVTLSGVMAAPAGNLRISFLASVAGTGLMQSANGACTATSYITAIRIG